MNKAQTRMTKQRKIILNVLREMHTHPTAEEVYTVVRKHIPNISLGTVYRNLDFLINYGDVNQINSFGAMRRFDGDISPHWHMHCIGCNCIIDIPLTALPSDIIKMDKLTNLEFNGFRVKNSRLEFDGYCAKCTPENEQHVKE